MQELKKGKVEQGGDHISSKQQCKMCLKARGLCICLSLIYVLSRSLRVVVSSEAVLFFFFKKTRLCRY